MVFRDRTDAGRQLSRLLMPYRGEAPLVLGLPRGGVVVAYEVARALGAQLDVWNVRKLGVPGQPELGFGALAEGGEIYLDARTVALLDLTPDEIAEVAEREAAELEQRVRRFRGGAAAPAVQGRTVIVVDDGIATGGTVRAVLRALRRRGPRRLVLAVPVASADTMRELRAEADESVCLDENPRLYAIGAHYEDFAQTSSEEVISLLEGARRAAPADLPEASRSDGDERSVRIQSGGVALEGDLAIPEGAGGLVLFAHGSGSGRRSPRNRFVAESLRRWGLATLLFDLLTGEEEAEDRVTAGLRFDIGLLARRLIGATDWVAARQDLRRLRVGYFGASTGAAAALVAAAERPDTVGAVVSRGGRPDLAGGALTRVRAPTLLIVGGEDTLVIELNRDALELLRAPRRIAVVPGATHLFEEPGALEQVARLAASWFAQHLTPSALVEARP